MTVRRMNPTAQRPAGTSLPDGIPANLSSPPDSTEPGLRQKHTDSPASQTTERPQPWAHPLQIRVLSLMILYALLIFFMLAIPVFQPLTQAVADPALTWQERARAGTDLLTLHDHYWPWALGAACILVLQCVHAFRAMRHLTAPLVRLRQALPRIRDGNLSVTTRLCREDYLTAETALLNQMTAQLTAKLSACKQAHATLALDYDRLKQRLATTRELDVAKLTRPIDQDLADLRSALDWFKTYKE
ncbi:MAG: hypothetical protein LZF86_110356 [Nitrospira sp.]|nr:MAG: hypothetical protein LZF86_110356 [Nitrospira sp.]